MRHLIPILGFAVLWPAAANALPRITAVDVEGSAEEVRVVIALDPVEARPAHRFMRDEGALRLLLTGSEIAETQEDLDDATIRRVVTRPVGDRAVIRLDTRGSPIDTLERAEVTSHDRGLVVVIRRSDAEASRYRAAHDAPAPPIEARATVEPEATPEVASASPPVPQPEASRSEPRDEQERAEREAAEPADPSRERSRPRPAIRPPATVTQASSGSSLRAAGAAALIVLLGGVAWFLRRRRIGGRGRNEALAIDILTAKRIGPRQSLLLIDVGGQTLLIGATEQGMTRLASFPEAFLGERPVEDGAGMTPDPDDTLTPLERELRKLPLPPDRPRRSDAFAAELEGAMTSPKKERSGGIEAARKIAARLMARPEREPGQEPHEGLLRLRQMAHRSALSRSEAAQVPTPTNGTSSHNGREMTLADLQALLGKGPN
jgi:flagellar biogenesis protein FliO